jgi:hypothetical protein
MDLSERPVQTPGLDVTEVEDGLVVYDPMIRRVHHLNVTAVLVFELSNGENTVADIVAITQRLFGLAEPPTDDVRAALDQLVTERLVSA